MHTRHAFFWWSIIADIDPGQSSEWRRAGTGRLVRISNIEKMAGSELESSGEKLKAEIAEQTRDIMREMFTEFKKEKKQEKQEQLRLEREIRVGKQEQLPTSQPERQEQPPAPLMQPFDLDYDEIRQIPMEDDQETLLAEPMVRRRLEVPAPILEKSAIRPRVEIPREAERPDWAKDLVKAMAQMKIQMKEKGIDAPLDYTDLDLYKGSDPLPRKFKFPDMRKYSGTEDPHLHLKQYVTYLSATELTNAQITKQFPLSLKGAPIRWYYNLESSVQND